MAALIFVIFCLIIPYTCNAYKVLVVTQMPSRSHSILNDAIVRQLLKDGNEVTYIRSIEYRNAPKTLRQIDVSSNKEALPPALFNINAIMNDSIEFNNYEYVKRIRICIGIRTMENEDIQKLLSDTNEHFDVVIVEFMDNDILASLAAVFDCPLIWMSPIEINSDIISRIDAVPNPSVMADYLSRNIIPFSFMQRLKELWSRIKAQYLYYWYLDDLQTEVYHRLIAPHIVKRGRRPPSFNDIRYSASLVLGYSHLSMGDAFSLPQNYKSVGGYHIDYEITPLPEDLKTVLDNAKDGVIYFSMGSNLKSAEFPQEIKQRLLRMLGGLKQTVLWKFEETIPNTYKNIHVSNWFPQMSILAHPNCVIFITHGGLLSTTETLHAGVPIIGIPAHTDQFVNIKRAVHKGFGLKVDMTYNIVDDLKVAIEEIMANNSYREKAKELSFIYHDRPVKPAEELSHWVRHVVQTRGAAHLRSPALQVPLYQRLHLDIIAIIVGIVILALKLLRYIYISIYQKMKLDINTKTNQTREKMIKICLKSK